MCIETAHGGVDKAQALGPDRLDLGKSHYCSVYSTIIRKITPNSHRSGLLGGRTWLPNVTSGRQALISIHSLFCPDRVGEG